MNDKVTKKMLSDCYKNLEKFNYLVKNFNGNRQIKFGAFTGFVDHLIISHSGIIFFIEAKLYKDKLKEKQEKLRDYLIESSKKNDFVFYCIATEKNYDLIYEYILTGKYKELKTLNK